MGQPGFFDVDERLAALSAAGDPRHARANAARSAVRSAIEHVFAGQKHRMKLFVRTIGLARAKAKIGMANLVYNFTRLVWLEARNAPA